MNYVSPKSSDSASPRMIALSACLHGLLLSAIILVSYYHVSKPAKTPNEQIVKATLTQSTPGPPEIDKISSTPVGEPDIVPQEAIAEKEIPKEQSPTTRSVLDEQIIAPPKDAIRVAKRKKPMRQVKKPKPPEKKPEPAIAQKEDPSAYVQKQIAELRKELAESATDASKARSSTGAGNAQTAIGKGGLTEGSEVVDRDLFLWFAQVRNRINARWSVFGENRYQERVTVVGVDMAEDGSLKEVSINRGSGDETFDRSAVRAVYQAAPFPKVPSEVAEKIRQAGGLAFRFTIKGMQ